MSAASRSPLHAHAGDRSWPKLLPGALEQSRPPVPLEWTPQEIALAQARCKAALKGLDVVAVPEVPIREAVECGAAAPMKLISVGRNPPISFSPPPVLNCDMIAALARWLSGDIQRLARRHLGASVIRVETMSSYSCRNAYGRPGRRLSEHGRANALDIRAFVTARGQSALVVADWGPTAREVEAAIARAQALEATTAAAAAPTRPQESTGAGQAALAPVPAGPSGIDSRATFAIPGLSLTIPGVSSGPSELGLTQPNRLGGPKPATVPGVAPSAPAVQPRLKTQFLRAAHRSACRTFGTVLGPEANKAHKNHFHVDMAERKAVPVICE